MTSFQTLNWENEFSWTSKNFYNIVKTGTITQNLFQKEFNLRALMNMKYVYKNTTECASWFTVAYAV
jgi:hypothetical protein